MSCSNGVFLPALKSVYNTIKGYVHGDILFKNIVFDGERLNLIDHDIRLKEGDWSNINKGSAFLNK